MQQERATVNRRQRRAAQRAARGLRSPIQILIVGETDHVQFTMLSPDRLEEAYAALPPELRDVADRADMDGIAGMLGELLDFKEHEPLSVEHQTVACALGAIYASRCETPQLAAVNHNYAAVGVFRLKHGGYTARWVGAFFAANDEEALARFGVALKIVHNTLGARELADYDPGSTLFKLLRAGRSG